MSTTRKKPRGIRNNNPLNIRVGNSWRGEVEHPTDHVFEQFQEMRYGVRAAFKILKNYITRHKLDTISKIVKRWAPANENDTEAYIKQVCLLADRKRGEKLEFKKEDMIPLFKGMCFVENGLIISDKDINDGWNLVELPFPYNV